MLKPRKYVALESSLHHTTDFPADPLHASAELVPSETCLPLWASVLPSEGRAHSDILQMIFARPGQADVLPAP